jgi:hypothetical protein
MKTHWKQSESRTGWYQATRLDKFQQAIAHCQIIVVVLLGKQIAPRFARPRECNKVDLEMLEQPTQIENNGAVSAVVHLALEHVNKDAKLLVHVALNVHETLAREARDELGLALVVGYRVQLAEHGVAIGIKSVEESRSVINAGSLLKQDH